LAFCAVFLCFGWKIYKGFFYFSIKGYEEQAAMQAWKVVLKPEKKNGKKVEGQLPSLCGRVT